MSYFTRKCPTCEKDLYYKTKKYLNMATKKKLNCKSCGKKNNDEIFVSFRNCPQCKKQINYKKPISLEHANDLNYQFKLCRSCISSSVMKGKTVYDQWLKKYGKEIADQKLKEMKKKQSLNNKGEKNSNYGGKYSRFESAIKWNKENLKGKTLEEVYGEEKAKNIKHKIGKSNSGENNPMYGKESPQGSGNGWSGHFKKVQFRSINEFFYLKYLFDNNIEFDNAEKKKYRVLYEFNGTKRSYSMDFYLPESDEYIEIKPKKLVNTPLNIAKFSAAIEVYGNKFKILTEDNLQKISLDEMWNLYLNKELVFHKIYEEKFINFYNKKKKEDNT